MNLAANITFVGLAVVFIALILLAVIISFFSKLINVRQKIADKNDHEASLLEIEDENYSEKPSGYGLGSYGNIGADADEETIAAITAAVYLFMECRNGYSLKVRSIKRVPQASPVWSATGRFEQLTGRL